MKTVHKYTRSLKRRTQFILCNGKPANFVESGISYFWANVTCKECKKIRDEK